MLQKIIWVIVGIIGLSTGCISAVSPQHVTHPTTTYAAEIPAKLNIIYIGSAGKQFGQLTEEALIRHNITILRDWDTAKKQAFAQPLDGLLTEPELLTRMTDDDKVWLRSHLSNGVIVVGLGVDLTQFAQVLGLETVRAPGEANTPLGPDQAFTIYGLILGQPQDVELMRANNWLMHSLQGEDVNFPEITAPLIRSAGTSRAQLTSKAGVDHFFKSLDAAIAGMYLTRGEYKPTH